MLVSRLPGATTTFYQTQSMAGSEAFNSNQFDQGASVGPRITLSYRGDAGYRLDLSYLAVRDLWGKQTTGPENPGDWYVMRAPGFWQTQDFYYQGMNWASNASLQSLELNATSRYSTGIEWLAGVRWLRLDDTLTGSLTPADANQPAWKQGGCASGSTQDEIAASVLGMTLPGTAQVCAAGGVVSGYPPFWTANTANDLFGVQAGAQGTLVDTGRLSLSGVAKAGVYANRARQDAAVSMEKQMYDAGAQQVGLALAVQAGVQVRFAFSTNLSAKLGYELLWLDRVALAPGQIGETLCVSTPGSVSATGVNLGSSLLLQGFTAGIELLF